MEECGESVRKEKDNEVMKEGDEEKSEFIGG